MPDTEADHDAQRRGELGHLDDVRHQRHHQGARRDTGERSADREAHGDDRTEREDQDEDREGEAEDLGFGRLELEEELLAELDLDAVEFGGELLELGSELGDLGVGDVAGDVDLGEGNRLSGEIWPKARSS